MATVQRKRGARSSRPHWLAYQATKDPKYAHVPRAVAPQFVPAVIPAPGQMSMWGNDAYGDCVTAEEFFAKCVYPVWTSKTGTMLDMPYALAVQWASQHGYLNGADLASVMSSMASDGVQFNGATYTDGPAVSVDYTTWSTLISSIAEGPVKIGVASSQFDNVPGVGEQNGFVMHGFSPDQNEDHCVALCGYGTMAWLAQQMGVSLPSGVDGSANGLLLYTWDSIGLIDFASMNAVTGEAWLRTPTTPQTPPPTPPTPTPGTYTFSLGTLVPAGASIDVSGTFTWSIPATQPVGPVTISFSVSAPGAATGAGVFVINVTTSTGSPTVTVGPIPPQTAVAGTTFTLPLAPFVSTVDATKRH